MFERGEGIGVLLTPSCMNLTALTLDPPYFQPTPLGWSRVIPFPSGRFEFLAPEEPGIGPFAACSLFSAMGDFPNQGTALATARAVLEALFEPQVREPPPPPRATSSDHRTRTEISRPDLPRGRFSQA